MKAVTFIKNSSLILAGVIVLSLNLAAQTENPAVNIDKQTETKPAAAETPKPEMPKPEPVKTPHVAPPETAANGKAAGGKKTKTAETKPDAAPTAAAGDQAATGDADEEAAVLPYYNNYLKEYRLGPNDIISIEVFGQCPDYCKTGLTVPPTARISYPLIREGVMVGGRTVEDVAAEVTKKLDEYIIDPKVTVTLDKAMSVRYSVMGKVAQPGIRVMDRKVSLYEAVIEAGGVTKDGNKKKVSLIRYDRQGSLQRQDVNLAEIETGKAPMIFLEPGDQVFVTGKGFTVEKFFDLLGKASVARILFGGF